MKRKLVKQGAATLMVSLPAAWLRRFSLGKGDEIELDESEDKLIISKEGLKGKRTADITLTKETETGVRTLITNAYRAGYDIVNVKFSSEAQLEAIRSTLRNYLLGYDITKKQEKSCVIENITEPSAEQFDALMHKIFFSIKELIGITRKRLEGKKVIEDYAEVTMRVYQYDSFCRRVAAKKQKEVRDLGLFWAFQTLVVHGQRDLYHLNRFMDKNKTKASKEALKLVDELEKMFNLLINGYLQKNTAMLEEVHEKEKGFIYKKSYSLLKSRKGNESIAVHHLMDSARNFYLAASPAMGLLLS